MYGIPIPSENKMILIKDDFYSTAGFIGLKVNEIIDILRSSSFEGVEVIDWDFSYKPTKYSIT